MSKSISSTRLLKLAQGIKKRDALPKFKRRKARSRFIDAAQLAAKYPSHAVMILKHRSNQSKLEVIRKQCQNQFAGQKESRLLDSVIQKDAENIIKK